MKTKNTIKVTKVEECKSVKITIEMNDELFDAVVEAGRQHILNDKDACFEYAFCKALEETCDV